MPSPLSRISRTYERSFKRNPGLTLAFTNGCLKCLGDFFAQVLPSLLEGKPFKLDGHRSLRFLLFGFLHGPCVGKWHEFLENRIPLTVSRPPPTSINLVVSPLTDSENAYPIPKLASPYHTIRKRSLSHSDDSKPLRQFMAPDTSPGYPDPFTNSTRSRRVWGLLKRLILDQLVMAPLFVLVFLSFTGFLEGLSLAEIKARLDNLYWHILTANWKIWPIIQIINFNFMPLQYRVPWQSSCGVIWIVFLSLSTHSSPNSTTTTTMSNSPARVGISMISDTISKFIHKNRTEGISNSVGKQEDPSPGFGKKITLGTDNPMDTNDRDARLRKLVKVSIPEESSIG